MKASRIPLNLKYTPAQQKFLFEDSSRFKIVSKGRRFGFTRGIAQATVEWGLEKPRYILWGDTVTGNIHSYFKRYIEPVLRQIPSDLWKYYKQDHKLDVGRSSVDFRSADRPENWEGFGYDIILLNEAGIILKNRYLWENAVRPMMLDNPESVAVIGGVPKGKNLFYELFSYANDDHEGWQAFKFSSYDNPLLKKEDIDELVKECATDNVIQQEIFGEFIDNSGAELFAYDLVKGCMTCEVTPDMKMGQEVWALDVARQGGDKCVLAKRLHRYVYELKVIDPEDDLMIVSKKVADEYGRADRLPAAIYVDVTQLGWGVFDDMRHHGMPVKPAVMAQKSVMREAKNKRAEMYLRLGNYMKEGLKLPNNNDLLMQLMAIELKPETELAQIISKKQIRGSLGRSPDEADAVGMLFYDEIFAANVIQFKPKKKAMNW